MSDDLEFYTTEQVCKMLQVGRTVLYEALRSGKLVAFRAGKGFRFTKQAILDYVRNTTVNPDEFKHQDSCEEEGEEQQ